MLTKTYDFPHKPENASGKYEKNLYFDIETTGFKRESTILYLIGCGYYEDDTFRILQWFNDDGTSEKEILCSFLSLLDKKNWTLVSFNGEGFDLPYLSCRLSMHQLDFSFSKYVSIDFYRILHPFREIFHMEEGKQRAWEDFLGISREDRFQGGQLIRIYKEYLLKREKKAEQFLLLHNMEDVRGMESLLPLMAYRELVTGPVIFENVAFDMGNAVFSCVLPISLPKPFSLSSSVGSFQAENHCVHVALPVFHAILKHFYPDHENYFYLPDEDRAIHKSIGCFVEKAHRKKATAKNCYIKKEGVYLPLSSSQKYGGFVVDSENLRQNLTIYKKEHRERAEYILIDDLFEKGNDTVEEYIQCGINGILMEGLRKIRKPGV